MITEPAATVRKSIAHTIWLRGLALPTVIGAAAVIVGMGLGAGAALVLVTVAASLLLVAHLAQLSALATWASGAWEQPVPLGAGPWETAFSALHRRVRARTARQQDLSSALSDLREASEALPDGMLILDPRDQIEWCNRQATRHLGVRMPDDSGRALVNLVRQPDFIAFLEEARYGEPFEMMSPRNPGVALALQIIPYAGHRLMISREITQVRKLETMRRDFIANISHELRTPLTVLIGYLEMLADGSDDATRQAAVTNMRTHACAMQHLVEDLLKLSALESPQSALQEEAVEIVPLLEQVRSDAVELSGGRHEISLRIDTGGVIIGARSELASAFGNLISNAVRYTPAGGKISLSWDQSGGVGVFSVEDTGLGIAAEHIPRLTERFYRVDRGRSRQTGGTGLGLAIVKHVVERHQAKLEIVSEPDKGSRFSIRFPAARLTTAAQAAASEREG